MWTLIGMLLLACVGVAALIAGTVVLVVLLVRHFARKGDNEPPLA